MRFADRRQMSPISWVINRPAGGRSIQLPIGRYRWRARSFWQRLEGGWVEAAIDARSVSFEVGPPIFDTVAGSPVPPYNLEVIPSLFRSGRADLVQASSYHPNNRAFLFEFEIKERNAAFDGTGITRTLSRAWDGRNTESIALTDSAPVPAPMRLEIINYHWRVRAIGDDNRTSPWVNGPDFDFIPVPNQSRNPDRWGETLSQIDPQLLLGKITDRPRVRPGSPPKGPRILIRLVSEPISEADILKYLESRKRPTTG
jgi:hypothetical protein